jgi:hypothetical protein
VQVARTPASAPAGRAGSTAAAPNTSGSTTVGSGAAVAPASSPSEAPTVAPAATSLAANRSSIEQTYDSEIMRLRTIVRQRRSQMDSTTAAVLDHNLKVIDDAIAQCKDALGKDPNSRFLMESLNDALDTKVQLLRTAATLPSKA